jgi:GDSL-like Lipase/Acylhydrolase family
MRGRRIARLILVLAGLLLPVLIVECGLKLVGPTLARYSYVGLDTKRNLSHFELHPVYGGFHIPNTTAWQWTVEYVTRVDINSHGLREREIDYEKPPGLRRVLVLGDSFVEATEVSVEEAFPRRLEAHLGDQGGPPTQVINAGAVGYGTAQEYLLLKHEGLRYQPDLVVLLFFSGNDVSDNSQLLDYPPVRSIKPYFFVDASGALRSLPFELPDLSASQAGTLRQRLRRESLLFSKLDPDELGRVAMDRGYIRSILTPYADTSSAEVEAAWHVTEALLSATRDQAEAAGARFVLVNVPAPWEIAPGFWDRMRWYFDLPADGWDFDRPNRRLAEIAARHRIAYLDLRPELRLAQTEPPRHYFQIDGHWTSAGHDFAARCLVQSGLATVR